jgi:hypothetical protein
MPDGEHLDALCAHRHAMERDMPGPTAGDHQLA